MEECGTASKNSNVAQRLDSSKMPKQAEKGPKTARNVRLESKTIFRIGSLAQDELLNQFASIYGYSKADRKSFELSENSF